MEPISKEAYDILYNIVLEDTMRLVGIEYDKIINRNKKVLTIRNIYKIIGEELDCKWLPKTNGWVVSSVEAVGDTYIFGVDDKSLKWGGAEIQLRREPYWFDGEIKYEMWAWNLENGKPEVKWCKQKDLKTIRDGVLWVGYMLEKILPNKI